MAFCPGGPRLDTSGCPRDVLRERDPLQWQIQENALKLTRVAFLDQPMENGSLSRQKYDDRNSPVLLN